MRTRDGIAAAALAIAAIGAAALFAGELPYPYVPPTPPPCDLAPLDVMITGDILTGHRPEKCYPGGLCVESPLDYTDDFLRAVFRAWWARATPDERQYLVDLGAAFALGSTDPSITSVRDVPPPSAFPGEDVGSATPIGGRTFDERTWLVEFRLSPHEDGLAAGGPPAQVARRGWLTRGSGFCSGGRFHHPLVVMGLGIGERFTGDEPSTRRELFRLVSEGECDVLCVDNRGDGISGGTNDLDNGAMGDDVFEMLDDLETGANLSVIPPGDRTRVLEGARLAPHLPLLPERGKATTTEVILDGGSMGEINSGIAMSKNFPAAGPGRGYNIKGMIGWSGHCGGAFYLNPQFVDPTIDAVVIAGYVREVGHITFGPDASVLLSAPRWPALLVVGKGWADEITGPDNQVYLYNRARGLKGIHLLPGPHDWSDFPACPGGKFDYMVDRELEFIPRMLDRDPRAPPDDTQTTLAAEACAYPKASPPPKCP
jgi:hypothetical protein